MAVTTSIRLPDEVREQYETLAQATGRTRNELMVEALRPIREGYAALSKDPSYIETLLREGADRVRPMAQQTMKAAFNAMGLG